VLLWVVHAEADAVPQVLRTFQKGGGFPVSVPSLAVSAGRGCDDGHLNLFLAHALLHVVRDAVLEQAPASSSVIPSSAVRGSDTGVSGSLNAGSVGQVSENAETLPCQLRHDCRALFCARQLLFVRS